MYNFADFKQKLTRIEEWLKKEFFALRSSRPSPAILDGVKIEAYGNRMPINQVATISLEDQKTLRVAPWDITQLQNINKAIQTSDLGLSVSVDDKGIRVIFPDLSRERREALVKVAKQKLEEAKVSIRTERERVWTDIQDKTKSGELGEDQKFKLKDEMQKIVDDVNKSIEEITSRKEKEILT
jgi:ribosome recycling factor